MFYPIATSAALFATGCYAVLTRSGSDDSVQSNVSSSVKEVPSTPILSKTASEVASLAPASDHGDAGSEISKDILEVPVLGSPMASLKDGEVPLETRIAVTIVVKDPQGNEETRTVFTRTSEDGKLLFIDDASFQQEVISTDKLFGSEIGRFAMTILRIEKTSKGGDALLVTGMAAGKKETVRRSEADMQRLVAALLSTGEYISEVPSGLADNRKGRFFRAK
jgi:hypothetical protein